MSYLPNDEHEVFCSTCMAQSGYGQSACWSDSMTSTQIVWSYPSPSPLPPPPRKKTQRRSWNASVHDATVVTNRQGTGHWHAHCYDTLTWGAKALVDTSCHHSSHQRMPSSTTTELPHLPKTSISVCNYFFIGSGWQPKLQMYLFLDRRSHQSHRNHHRPRCLCHTHICKIDWQNVPFKPHY